MGIEGIWVWRGQGFRKGHGYGGDMGLEKDKGMEGTWVWKGYGYGEDRGLERDMGMKGI